MHIPITINVNSKSMRYLPYDINLRSKPKCLMHSLEGDHLPIKKLTQVGLLHCVCLLVKRAVYFLENSH